MRLGSLFRRRHVQAGFRDQRCAQTADETLPRRAMRIGSLRAQFLLTYRRGSVISYRKQSRSANHPVTTVIRSDEMCVTLPWR